MTHRDPGHSRGLRRLDTPRRPEPFRAGVGGRTGEVSLRCRIECRREVPLPVAPPARSLRPALRGNRLYAQGAPRTLPRSSGELASSCSHYTGLLPRQAEPAGGDDGALDLARAALDRVRDAAEEG